MRGAPPTAEEKGATGQAPAAWPMVDRASVEVVIDEIIIERYDTPEPPVGSRGKMLAPAPKRKTPLVRGLVVLAALGLATLLARTRLRRGPAPLAMRLLRRALGRPMAPLRLAH